jgi:hypothetical protein
VDALCVPYFVLTVGTERVCCSTCQYRPEPAGTELLRTNLSALVSPERVVSTSTCRYRAYVQGIALTVVSAG